MTRAELVALASPPCRECGEPVQRVEYRWDQEQEGGTWRLGAVMVCGDGHRHRVKPLD
jgi:hypothetical protein